MALDEIKVGMSVYDSWWPIERRGRVRKITQRCVYVAWLDGTEWRYDRGHLVFLKGPL